MGVDHSKLLEKQREEIRNLEEKLAKARAIQVLERRLAISREKTRQEEREDKKSSILLNEKRRQEDRAYMHRRLEILELIEKEEKDEMKRLAEYRAENDADSLRFNHQSTESDKQRKLEKYELEKQFLLERDAHDKKYQLLHELLQSCRDSPDIKDILKTSMDSMSYSFRRDNC